MGQPDSLRLLFISPEFWWRSFSGPARRRGNVPMKFTIQLYIEIVSSFRIIAFSFVGKKLCCYHLYSKYFCVCLLHGVLNSLSVISILPGNNANWTRRSLWPCPLWGQSFVWGVHCTGHHSFLQLSLKFFVSCHLKGKKGSWGWSNGLRQKPGCITGILMCRHAASFTFWCFATQYLAARERQWRSATLLPGYLRIS